MKIRDENGTSLVELMVMVSIVLIVTALAIPTYSSSIARSEQSEAKAGLAEIYVRMMDFEPSSALAGFVGASLDNIGFNPPDNAYYDYSLVEVTEDGFLARAEGVAGRVVGDVWEVNDIQNMPIDLDEDKFDA